MSESTTATTAQDAVRRAQEIAARLSNQYPIVVAGGVPTTTTVATMYQPSAAATVTASTSTMNGDQVLDKNSETTGTTKPTTSGSKRKRWGVMSTNDENSTDVTTTTSTNTNTNLGVVTANPQIPIAQLLLQQASSATTVAATITTTGGTTSSSSTTAASAAATALTSIGGTPPTIKRLWVTVNNERPAAHYIAYCTPKIRQIVNKANGILSSTTTSGTTNHSDEAAVEKDATKEDDDVKQNDDDNEEDETKLRIMFKGKGSTNIPPLPGVPEEPLHIYMIGPKILVDTTTKLIDECINEASRADPLIDAVIAAQHAKDQALQLITVESISAAAGNNSNPYKPMSVTALIHGNNSNITNGTKTDDNALLALPADRLAAALLHGTSTMAYTQEMTVPNNVVGTIIGKGGETIASIQAQTNVKLQIQKETDMIPGQVERIITMSSNTQDSINQCQSIIQTLVHERLQKMNSHAVNMNPNNNNQQQNQSYSNHGNSNNNNNSNTVLLLDGSTVPSYHTIVEVLVPDADVGLVIGKGGVTIKQIQEQSGSNVHVPKSANIDNPTVRTLQVTCPNAEGAQLGKKLIEDVLRTKLANNMMMNGGDPHQQQAYGGGRQYQQQQVSLQVSVPDKDVGLCIGRGGCVIKYMQGLTHTRIQIPPTVPNPGDLYRIITVLGPSMEACQQVQSMIHQILSEQSSASVMSGNHHAQQQQYGAAVVQQSQYQNTVQANQPGYSAEWAAYHAAQQQQQQQYQVAAATATPTVDATAMAAAAAVAQQQQAAAAAAVITTATTAVAATTNEYTEPFFRYAYYYGEEAARQYYGAWSPPVGTPNPYGVNPNGITAAPAPVATATTATAGTSATTENQSAASATLQGQQQQQQAYATEQGVATAQTASTTSVSVQQQQEEAARETSRRHVSNLPAWMTKK